MAKKGQAIQLQTEVNNDEEWEKLLQRDGLIVADVYSEWCGPCSGMTATLKKLKLEIGGDVLQLATVKADKITALARFRNKSEPTWMFISNGRMVNFMFGANAPKLTRLITEELKKEKEVKEGRRERTYQEISELADEERERQAAKEDVERAAREKEVAKAEKELLERRTAECHKILESLSHFGIILIFPHARTSYQEAFGDLLGEAGLNINQQEKVNLTQEKLDELFYFGEIPFPEESMEELLNNTSLMLLIKPQAGKDLEDTTDSIVSRIVYGAMKEPPGSPDSVARTLSKLPIKPEEKDDEEDTKSNRIYDYVAIWTPENELIKATALKLFFPKLTEHHLIAAPEPIPQHYAVVFEAFRRNEVLELMNKYPDEILHYGFFTSESPEDAQLVAKSIKKFEKGTDRAPDQKMVIELAKRKSECVLAFAQMKPLYMSPNVKEGKRECAIFFPDDYEEPPEEEEEEEDAEQSKTIDGETTTGEEGEVLGEVEGSQMPTEGVPEEGQLVAEEGIQSVAEEGGQSATEGSTVAHATEGVAEPPPESVETVENAPIDSVAEAPEPEQVHISDLVLEEILYFSEEHEDDYRREELLSKPSITLLMKRSSENLPNAIDDVVAQMVYGNLRKPPGDPNSPYQKLLLKKDEIEIPGIWTPPNASCKALALKWFFPNISNPFKLPEETPVPSHLIIGYDAFKYKEVMELSKQYPEAVMKYGFFSTDIPGESQLITKTVEKFEKRPAPPTYDEKIVIQLAKSDEWLTEFCELGPSYMSSDTVKGAEDAKAFFPATYDIPEDIILEIKKKPKKKVRGKFVAVVEAHEEQILQIDKEASTEPANESEQQTVDDSGDGPLSSEDKGGDNEGDEEEVGDVDVEGEAEEVDETDKATSPMVEEKEEQLE